MRTGFWLMAAALAAAPAAVAMAQGDAPVNKQKSARERSQERVCTTEGTLGTRLGATRRCRTRAEYQAEQRESREVVDRVQSHRPTLCSTVQRC